MYDQKPTDRLTRTFIRPPSATTICEQSKTTKYPSLLSTLPKDPEELSHAELLERFKELALRCFNKESQLDVAKELIANYENVIKELRQEQLLRCDISE